MRVAQPTEERAVQDRLNWHVAWRGGEKVVQATGAGETRDEIHCLSDAGLPDAFLIVFRYSIGTRVTTHEKLVRRDVF